MLPRLFPLRALLLSLVAMQPLHAQTGNTFVDSLPKSCNMQSGEGCHIRSMIVQKSGAISEMFSAKKYPELERLTQAMCAGQRMTDGQPELFALEQFFGDLADLTDDHPETQRRLAAWRSAAPDSIGAALGETVYWYHYAWIARGRDYAGKVPKEAWELFRTRLDRAASLLEESRPFASACPLWHSLHISVLLEQGAERTAIDSAYTEAVKRFPDSHHVHRAMARTTLRQWGGSDAQFDQFAWRAAQLSAASEGFGMYARLYRMKDCNSCDDAISFAPGTLPAWPDLKRGFEDQITRYPHDLWNRNKLAAYACRAGDTETYTIMRAAIGKHIYKELWHSSYSPDVCDLRSLRQP